MPESATTTVDCSLEPRGEPWPRAVAYLAVVAHVCVALAIWTSSKPPSNANAPIHSGVVLLAQANLLIIWLILGQAPWLRRIAWAVCGLSAILYLWSTSEWLQHRGFVVIVVLQAATTAVLVTFVRLLRFRVAQVNRAHARDLYTSIGNRQFSLLEIFGASLGIAVAAAMLVRTNFADSLHPWNPTAYIRAMLFGFLPWGVSTLIALMGMLRTVWLSWQLLLSCAMMVLSLAFITDRWDRSGVLLVVCGSSHWFLVAATMWIFQMCGYRLARVGERPT